MSEDATVGDVLVGAGILREAIRAGGEVVVEMDAVMRCSGVHMAERQEEQQEGGGDENGCYGNAQ
jgi:hypothetical protein